MGRLFLIATLIVVMLCPYWAAYADVQKIQISTYDNTDKSALLFEQKKSGKYPAIVYMHGGLVREKGNPTYRKNGEFFFDVKDKVIDFASMGYVVLAPFRSTPEGCCNGDDAIKEGISLAHASAQFLKSLPHVKKDKICLLGFSEGALISMWSMTQKNDYAAAIVMSPSRQCGMRRAGSKNYCAKNLEKSGKLEKINKKIIITLGKSERKAHRKTAQNFSKLLKTEIRYFRGEHKSFVFPRDDVKELIRLECS